MVGGEQTREIFAKVQRRRLGVSFPVQSLLSPFFGGAMECVSWETPLPVHMVFVEQLKL